MTREELDAIERGPTDEELAEEIALYEQYQAWQEVQRGDVRAIQRRLTKLLGDQVTHVPVGHGVIRHREEDAA
jgi:hypothetical protein